MISIKNCTQEDAPFIGQTIMMALHEEYDLNEPWSRIFTTLSQRDDSQYSYRNALKAVTDDGRIAGIIIAYDGGKLHSLREQFFHQFKEEFGFDITPVADETTEGEWYLDSLAVFPEFRGQSIAGRLLQAAIDRAPSDLRPGLLCSKSNPDAARLYEKFGFHNVGERPFMGELMNHYSLI